MWVKELHNVYNMFYAHHWDVMMKSKQKKKSEKIICKLRQEDMCKNENKIIEWVIWHSIVRFMIRQWIESCNRHFVLTLVASPTMAFERQTTVRAAGRSTTAVKVVIPFQLQHPGLSIMSVSLCCKETFVSHPVHFLIFLLYSLSFLEWWNLLFLFQISLFLCLSLASILCCFLCYTVRLGLKGSVHRFKIFLKPRWLYENSNKFCMFKLSVMLTGKSLSVSVMWWVACLKK